MCEETPQQVSFTLGLSIKWGLGLRESSSDLHHSPHRNVLKAGGEGHRLGTGSSQLESWFHHLLALCPWVIQVTPVASIF